MEAAATEVSVDDLKKIVLSIAERKHKISIRFRTVGQLWYPNFLRILKVEDGKRILFHDEKRKFFISLRDLTAITQFELDGRFNGLEPNFHYQVMETDCPY